jgi:hypothetical protein
VSRWQRDHEGFRRNAIGKFRWEHGLCAADGGRLGDELAGAQYLEPVALPRRAIFPLVTAGSLAAPLLGGFEVMSRPRQQLSR